MIWLVLIDFKLLIELSVVDQNLLSFMLCVCVNDLIAG